MLRLIIFGGTSEGRELAEWAAENGFSVILCVATDYVGTVCSPNEYLTIRKGRMDSDEISAFLKNERPSSVIDATHPHAAEVSDNISVAAKELNLPLIRVVRPSVKPCKDNAYSEWEKESVFYASSPSEAAEYLKKDDAPILLTTGSKELPQFKNIPGFANRVYARVLPQSGILSACEKAGLDGKHIIAMQGPFSTELNMALIKSTGAGWLVTKESGESGGYPEKMEAARKCGIRAVVIRRPRKEEGLSLDETIEQLQRLKASTAQTEAEDNKYGPVNMTLIGLGMGGGSQLTLEALEAIKASSVIFGAERMLNDISPYTGDIPLVSLYKCEEILSYLNEHPEYKKICVVFSGDTGFYSGCADFCRASDINIKVLPGISSFSCLCARFGLREEEFTPASAHGKDVDIVKLLKSRRKVFLLLDPKTTIGTVCRAVTEAGLGDTLIYAGIRLGYPDEELLCGKAEDITQRNADALAVMALETEGDK